MYVLNIFFNSWNYRILMINMPPIQYDFAYVLTVPRLKHVVYDVVHEADL